MKKATPAALVALVVLLLPPAQPVGSQDRTMEQRVRYLELLVENLPLLADQLAVDSDNLARHVGLTLEVDTYLHVRGAAVAAAVELGCKADVTLYHVVAAAHPDLRDAVVAAANNVEANCERFRETLAEVDASSDAGPP